MADGRRQDPSVLMESQMIVGLETLKNDEPERVMQAIRVYMEFYVPAHRDGKTPSEKAQVERPKWLVEIAGNERESISETDRSALDTDHMYFSNCRMQQMLNDWIDRKPFAEVLEKISAKLREPGVEELLNENRRKAISRVKEGMSENETALTDSKDDTLHDSRYDYATVVTPYLTTYEVRNPDECWSRLLSYSQRRAIRYHGSIQLIVMDDSMKPDAGGKSVVMHMLPLTWSRVRIGTRLGTVHLNGSLLEVSSTFESRHIALCSLAQDILGRHLTYRNSNRDVIEKSLLSRRR